MTNWERVQSRFNLTRDSANVRCPCHDDRMASLAVKRKGDDALLFCFAGCKYEDLARELGLSRSANAAHTRTLSPVPHRRVVAEYRYRDYAGDVIAIKRRFEPKLFDWLTLRADGEFQPKFPEGMSQSDLPLYRLPEAVGASKVGEPVFILEGEKDCDTLHELGLIGVCNPEGASGAASACDPSRFVGIIDPNTPLIICPDNDEPGRKHALRMAEALAPTFPVSILALPNLPEKGDVSDWVAAQRSNGTPDSGIAAELRYLAAHAMPHIAPNHEPNNEPNPSPYADVFDDNAREAVIERAAVLSVENGWPLDACERIARHQVGARVARERASLTPAQRLALETTDPALRDIYAQLAAMTG